MKRFKHSLSHYKLLTCDMGKLVPLTWYEVLPGDSVQQATSLLVRFSPLVAPVMHPVKVSIHHWFVPYRLLWDQWEDFITGKANVAIPTWGSGATGWDIGSLADYFGIPPKVPNISASAAPFGAYKMVWNEYYRDQDLQAELADDPPNLLPVSWEKDYFTTARPWAQKGPDVTVPLGITAPVLPKQGEYPTVIGAGITAHGLASAAGNPSVQFDDGMPGATARLYWNTTGMEADLTNATAANINDIRKAFALQRYQEARAQYGSRYTEYLRYLGVRPSDARLQRPEYLGGGKATVSFSEVLKTGGDDETADPIGTMKGHGITALRSRRFRRFFEEHGVVLSLLAVRPRAIYSDGLHRAFLRKTKEDFWQKELEHIGQQEVSQQEVYASETGEATLFGYQDRYSEYRHHPSSIAGEFRTTLNYWHLARQFAAAPALNADFIECDPGKRIFAEQTQHSLWCMASHSIQARRMVGKSTIGRIV